MFTDFESLPPNPYANRSFHNLFKLFLHFQEFPSCGDIEFVEYGLYHFLNLGFDVLFTGVYLFSNSSTCAFASSFLISPFFHHVIDKYFNVLFCYVQGAKSKVERFLITSYIIRPPIRN